MDLSEHDKLEQISGVERQAIGNFLEWLDEHYIICQATQSYVYPFQQALLPIAKGIRALLSEFYGIDEQKFEDEKRQLLNEQSIANDPL